jgi:mannose-6-phosphate isomerase-like protein (cupin superfamily)
VIAGPGAGRRFTIGNQVATVKSEGGPGPAVVETLLPSGAGAPRHLHHDHDEVFYVVSGTVEVEVDGVMATIGAGGLARADRGSSHGFRNPGPDDAVVLAVYNPPVGLAYLEELGAAVALPDADARRAAVTSLYDRYATEPA